MKAVWKLLKAKGGFSELENEIAAFNLSICPILLSPSVNVSIRIAHKFAKQKTYFLGLSMTTKSWGTHWWQNRSFKQLEK